MTRRPSHQPDRVEGMGCFEAPVLEEYYFGSVTKRVRAKIDRHLESCDSCRQFLEDVAAGELMGELLREARHEIPRELRHRLIETSSTVIQPGPQKKEDV